MMEVDADSQAPRAVGLSPDRNPHSLQQQMRSLLHRHVERLDALQRRQLVVVRLGRRDLVGRQPADVAHPVGAVRPPVADAVAIAKRVQLGAGRLNIAGAAQRMSASTIPPRARSPK